MHLQSQLEKNWQKNSEENPHEQEVWEAPKQLFTQLKGEMFIALPTLNITGDWTFLAGLQIRGAESAWDTFVTQIRDHLPEPPVKFESEGREIYRLHLPGAGRKPWFLLSYGGWALLSSSDYLLKQMARAVDQPLENSLAQSERFKLNLRHHDTRAVTWTYINLDPVKPLINLGLQMVGNTGANWDQMGGYQSISASTTVQDGFFRDQWFLEMPTQVMGDMGRMKDPLTGTSLKLTSPSTLLYAGTIFDAPAYLDRLRRIMSANSVAVDEAIREADRALAPIGITVQQSLQNLGTEMGFWVEWPEDQPAPYAVLFVPHHDASISSKLIGFALKKLVPDELPTGSVRHTQNSSGEHWTIRVRKKDPFTVSLWSEPEHVLAVIGQDSETALQAILAGHRQGTIQGSAAFQATKQRSKVQKPSTTLFLDTAQLVRRGYPLLAESYQHWRNQSEGDAQGLPDTFISADTLASPLKGSSAQLEWADGHVRFEFCYDVGLDSPLIAIFIAAVHYINSQMTPVFSGINEEMMGPPLDRSEVKEEGAEHAYAPEAM